MGIFSWSGDRDGQLFRDVGRQFSGCKHIFSNSSLSFIVCVWFSFPQLLWRLNATFWCFIARTQIILILCANVKQSNLINCRHPTLKESEKILQITFGFVSDKFGFVHFELYWELLFVFRCFLFYIFVVFLFFGFDRYSFRCWQHMYSYQ